MLQEITNHVLSWKGVTSASHRFGGVEFRLGKTEIGHIHASGMVDIPLSRAIREQLVKEQKALEHHLLKETGWITFYVHKTEDIEQAIWLFRLSYLQKVVRRERLSWEDADIQAELTRLKLSTALQNALTCRPIRTKLNAVD